MSKKFYRVKKDTFMWSEGAILEHNENKGTKGGYEAISDVWDACELDGGYISARIIENSSDWFERVYEVSILSKTSYLVKEEAKKLFNSTFKE